MKGMNNAKSEACIEIRVVFAHQKGPLFSKTDYDWRVTSACSFSFHDLIIFALKNQNTLRNDAFFRTKMVVLNCKAIASQISETLQDNDQKSSVLFC